MKKRLVLAVIIAAGVAFWFTRQTPLMVTEVKNEPPTAAVVNAKVEDLKTGITLSADFRPFMETDVNAKVAGYLKNLTVDIGDRVKAGQVIAAIEMDELKADLDRTKAAYHDAKLDYDRVRAVIKKNPGLLAQEEVDKAQAGYEMAKANMEKAKVLLDYATITVPFDGVVTKRFVDPGAMMPASVTSSNAIPLVHIAMDSTLRLDFPVPESAVPLVKVGTPVEITVKATGQAIQAKVARISGKLDSATHTMLTEIDVDNRDRRISPGMFAEAQITLERRNGVCALPPQAVAFGKTATVWVVNQQNTIEERQVKTGMQTPEKVEILEGVRPGENAVFGNRGALAPGMKVTPKPVVN